MRKSAVEAYRYMVSKKGKEVTPTELNDQLGVGNYASRHVWILKNILGCTIDVKKNGRNVVGYVLTAHPEKEPDELKGRAKKVKTATKKVAKKSVAPSETKKVETKAKPVKKVAKKPAKVFKAKKEVDVGGTEETREPVISNIAIDQDFDNIDVNDVMRSLA